MKKKSIALSKKLILNKEMLTRLDTREKSFVVGGATALCTRTVQCESFATIRPGQHICQLCP